VHAQLIDVQRQLRIQQRLLLAAILVGLAACIRLLLG
jgi:hypothetical protein